MTIKEKVGQLVKKYGTSNPYELTKAMSIEVEYVPLGNTHGFFTKLYRTFIISINEELPYEKQLFALMHELGHVVLHPELNSAFLKTNTFYITDRYEDEANLFAVELLLYQNNSITIKEATEEYGVSDQLLQKNIHP